MPTVPKQIRMGSNPELVTLFLKPLPALRSSEKRINGKGFKCSFSSSEYDKLSGE